MKIKCLSKGRRFLIQSIACDFSFSQFYKVRVPNSSMKIMRVVDKKVGSMTYYKYRINLPKEAVEKLNLLDKKLKIKIEKNRLVLEKE